MAKGFKGQLSEGGIMVPLIMKVPGNSSHEIVRTLAFTCPWNTLELKQSIKANLKAINLPKEFGGDSQWHLYHLSVDPQESKDLSKEQPAVMQELIATYDQFANQANIILPDFATLGVGVPDTTAFDG